MRFVLIFLIFLSVIGCKSTRNSIEYTDPGFYLRPVLKMKIVPTFSNPVIYEVTRHEPYKLVTITYEGAGGYDWKGVKSKTSIELTKEEYSTLVTKLEKALEFPKDKVRGKDGDTWMLESSLYQYTAVAFWEPENQTDKRGLVNFVNLKNYITQLSSKR